MKSPKTTASAWKIRLSVCCLTRSPRSTIAPPLPIALELEYRRWIRAQHSLRVVLLDIDNFKAINDSFGYTAGDKALKIIARTITKEAGTTDTVARFSGEEFVLLLPEQTDEYCHQVIQNIQSASEPPAL